MNLITVQILMILVLIMKPNNFILIGMISLYISLNLLKHIRKMKIKTHKCHILNINKHLLMCRIKIQKLWKIIHLNKKLIQHNLSILKMTWVLLHHLNTSSLKKSRKRKLKICFKYKRRKSKNNKKLLRMENLNAHYVIMRDISIASER